MGVWVGGCGVSGRGMGGSKSGQGDHIKGGP